MSLQAITHLGILLAVLKYFGIFSMIGNVLNKFKSSVEQEDEEEYEEYCMAVGHPSRTDTTELESMSGYRPGDDELFDPANFSFATGLYSTNVRNHDFEDRLYNVETGVEEM